MLPPIRPRPITAICMVSRECFVDGGAQGFEPALDVVEMQADGAAAAFVEHLEIAERLHQLYRGEIKPLVFQRNLLAPLAGDGQEHALIWPSLVGLPGRMKVTRPEARYGGGLSGVTHFATHGIDDFFMCKGLLDVSQNSKIVG